MAKRIIFVGCYETIPTLRHSLTARQLIASEHIEELYPDAVVKHLEQLGLSPAH